MPDDTKTDEGKTDDKSKDENGGKAGSEIDVEALVKSAVDAATEAATAAANSTADKRINQFLDKIETSQPKGDDDSGKSKGKGQDPTEAANAAILDRLTKTQRRLLVSAVRDEVNRLDENIRPMALDMAKEVAGRMTLTDDMDEDDVAVEIVEAVEKQLGTAKETFEKDLRADLKSRGLLKDDDGEEGGGGQGPKDGDDGSGKTDPIKQMEAGAEAAKKRFKKE